ncbi:hypothetical protein ACHAXR_008716 [Thalassiosira sp. AJA248-18]
MPTPLPMNNLQPLHDYSRAVSSSKGRLMAALLCFVIFIASKISSNRSLLDDSAETEEEPSIQQFADRHNCQIIYVLGVEGTVHHGFTPILETLARQQVDSSTSTPYVVTYADNTLRSALFGFRKESRPLDNPTLVRNVIRKICPHNHIKHVIIEDSSFPSSTSDDKRTYRIHRQPWWTESTTTMEEIAMSDTAMNHPTNLYTFYKEFSPYANIQFVVLHRSFIETIASHAETFSPIQHSTVVRGFMLLLRRFLDSHTYDELTGQRLWTLVCVEQIMSKFHNGDDEQIKFTRQHILSYLADFLGWPQDECPDCYSGWKESSKKHLEVLGEDNVAILLEHMRKMGGIWRE